MLLLFDLSLNLSAQVRMLVHLPYNAVGFFDSKYIRYSNLCVLFLNTVPINYRRYSLLLVTVTGNPSIFQQQAKQGIPGILPSPTV